ncbi:CehA/McbA family metallohydrolase [Mycobacterium sp. URHB0021]
MELNRRQLMAVGGAVVAIAGLNATRAFAAPDTGGRTSVGGGAPKGIWLAGDTHVHDDHSADGSLPRQQSKQVLPGNLPVADQIGQGERTGLDFMPLTDHRTFDQHWDPGWKSSNLLLIPGEEANGSPHAIVLGAVDTVVDGANPPGSPGFRHVQQSIWDARAQNAIWQTAHPDDGEFTPAGGPTDNASVQGMSTVEVYNDSTDPEAQITYAEDRWNRGFRFGVAAASDDHFRELWGIAGPGQPTTYAFVTKRSVQGVLDALRAGRTTVSASRSGPMATLEADVDGDGEFEAIGGDEVIVTTRSLPKNANLRVRVKAGAGTTVHVYAAPGRSAGPLTTFSPASDDEQHLVPITLMGDHSWFRVEVRAPGSPSGADTDPSLPDQLRAATSPIFISMRQPADPRPEIPLPAQAAGSEPAALAAGDAGMFTGFADIATEDSIVHAVFERHTDASTSVIYQQMTLIGRNKLRGGKAIEISDGSATARWPRIAISGKDVWVVWQDERGQEQPHRPSIFLRHSSNGGASFDSAVQLTNGTGRAVQPAIALVDGDHPAVAWADNSGGAFDVYAQIVGSDKAPINLSANGKTTNPGVAGDARSPRFPASLFPSVAVGSQGRVIVAWEDDRFDPDPLWTGHTPAAGEAPSGTDPDNWQILAAVRADSGSWSAPVKVSAATNAADRHPSVIADGDGAFAAIWESKALQSSGANLSLHSAWSSDGGKSWSTSAPVASDANAMSQRARLSSDSDGTVRAVWYDSRSSDWRWKVFTAVLNGSQGWGEPKMLGGTGNCTWPSADKGIVAFTSDGAAERTQRDITHQVYISQVT